MTALPPPEAAQLKCIMHPIFSSFILFRPDQPLRAHGQVPGIYYYVQTRTSHFFNRNTMIKEVEMLHITMHLIRHKASRLCTYIQVVLYYPLRRYRIFLETSAPSVSICLDGMRNKVQIASSSRCQQSLSQSIASQMRAQRC
eukprot:4792556-Pleurochrysis_carterae.AAC.1